MLVNARNRVLGRVHSACQSTEYPSLGALTGNNDIERAGEKENFTLTRSRHHAGHLLTLVQVSTASAPPAAALVISGSLIPGGSQGWKQIVTSFLASGLD